MVSEFFKDDDEGEIGPSVLRDVIFDDKLCSYFLLSQHRSSSSSSLLKDITPNALDDINW